MCEQSLQILINNSYILLYFLIMDSMLSCCHTCIVYVNENVTVVIDNKVSCDDDCILIDYYSTVFSYKFLH